MQEAQCRAKKDIDVTLRSHLAWQICFIGKIKAKRGFDQQSRFSNSYSRSKVRSEETFGNHNILLPYAFIDLHGKQFSSDLKEILKKQKVAWHFEACNIETLAFSSSWYKGSVGFPLSAWVTLIARFISTTFLFFSQPRTLNNFHFEN